MKDKILEILVVGAWEPELASLRAHLSSPGGAAATEELGVIVVLQTLGVGPVEAAVAMTQRVELARPAAALFVGTCGTFATRATVGTVVGVTRASLVDAAVLDGRAALPRPMPAVAALDAGILAALVAAGARSVHLANTVGITTDDALAARLGAAGPFDVEHLETFGFARACVSASVPCGAVLGIANTVGSAGRAEWMANHEEASRRAGEVAFRALAAIAAAVRLRTPTTAP